MNQPNPCAPVEVPNDNLAYGKPVTASRSLSDQPPEYAVDDNANTQWGSGEHPVQWIQIDLQGTYRVTEIRLLVGQYPAGNTIHRVQVRASGGDAFQTVYEFNGSTNDNDWLVFKPDIPLENVGQIRIQTIASPSWVSWKEIQVYGELMLP
ncbi:MAG: discoidin domain-containing protein [Anaerolineae bacterium]|nr:discoidin domain-containing protein [Anaerolineae bacterium]